MNRQFFLTVRFLISLFGGLLIITANSDAAEKLNIAVAANFLQTFNDIQSVYEEQTGVMLSVSSGATGQLYHQIRFGAPYDIFLSADKHTSQRLIKEELALASSYFVYARGRMVLWSWDETLVLNDGAVFRNYDKNKRFAIANPKVAPYGKAAKDILTAIEADKRWQKNIITGQNITQAYQFIASGNVDMGFISLAQFRFAKTQKEQNYWLIPNALHQPIEQTAVLLQVSKRKSQAMHFLNFLQTPTALAIMQRYGYE